MIDLTKNDLTRHLISESIEQLKKKSRLLWEKNRLKTFKNWPFSDTSPCCVAKLAEAGFYFIGNEREVDTVQCFFCDKTLDGWEEEDNPWTEHLSHSPACVFAQNQTPEDALTAQELIECYQKLLVKEFENIMNIIRSDIDDLFAKKMLELKKQCCSK